MSGQEEKRRSILTGKIYRVKAIDDWSVILESLDGSSEVCTESDNLKLFYENLEEDPISKDLDHLRMDPSSSPNP